MKKFLAILLSVMLVLTFGIVAFATGSITISNNHGNDPEADGPTTYTYYQVFDAAIASQPTVDPDTGVDSGDGKVSYTIPGTSSALATAIAALSIDNGTTPLFTVNLSNGTYYVTLNDQSATAADIAAALDGSATVKSNALSTGTFTKAAGAANATATGLADGYYLITSSLGSKLAVQTLGSNVEITEKNVYPSVDKKQKDTASGTFGDTEVVAAIGDTIYYSVEVYVPADANADIVVTDTMSSGLTYDSSTGLDWAVSGGGTISADNPTATPDPIVNDYIVGTATAPATWTATIHPTASTLGKTITITFQATVDADCLTDTTRNNSVHMAYKSYTQDDHVDYTTYATGAVKYDGATATASEGVLTPTGAAITYLNATFKLQISRDNGSTWTDVSVYRDADGYYRPIDPTASPAETAVDITSDFDTTTSAADGQIMIRGLDNGTGIKYQLVEITAPAGGYNLLTTPAGLTLTEDEKTDVSIDAASGEPDANTTYLTAASVVKIENNTGSNLPSTGGIGTTIFYIVGAILVLGAGILIVAKRRSAANAEQ